VGPAILRLEAVLAALGLETDSIALRMDGPAARRARGMEGLDAGRAASAGGAAKTTRTARTGGTAVRGAASGWRDAYRGSSRRRAGGLVMVVVVFLGKRAGSAHQAEHSRRRCNSFHGSRSSKAMLVTHELRCG
jgi:hypothetical protein